MCDIPYNSRVPFTPKDLSRLAIFLAEACKSDRADDWLAAEAALDIIVSGGNIEAVEKCVFGFINHEQQCSVIERFVLGKSMPIFDIEHISMTRNVSTGVVDALARLLSMSVSSLHSASFSAAFSKDTLERAAKATVDVTNAIDSLCSAPDGAERLSALSEIIATKIDTMFASSQPSSSQWFPFTIPRSPAGVLLDKLHTIGRVIEPQTLSASSASRHAEQKQHFDGYKSDSDSEDAIDCDEPTDSEQDGEQLDSEQDGDQLDKSSKSKHIDIDGRSVRPFTTLVSKDKGGCEWWINKPMPTRQLSAAFTLAHFINIETMLSNTKVRQLAGSYTESARYHSNTSWMSSVECDYKRLREVCGCATVVDMTTPEELDVITEDVAASSSAALATSLINPMKKRAAVIVPASCKCASDSGENVCDTALAKMYEMCWQRSEELERVIGKPPKFSSFSPCDETMLGISAKQNLRLGVDGVTPSMIRLPTVTPSLPHQQQRFFPRILLGKRFDRSFSLAMTEADTASEALLMSIVDGCAGEAAMALASMAASTVTDLHVRKYSRSCVCACTSPELCTCDDRLETCTCCVHGNPSCVACCESRTLSAYSMLAMSALITLERFSDPQQSSDDGHDTCQKKHKQQYQRRSAERMATGCECSSTDEFCSRDVVIAMAVISVALTLRKRSTLCGLCPVFGAASLASLDNDMGHRKRGDHFRICDVLSAIVSIICSKSDASSNGSGSDHGGDDCGQSDKRKCCRCRKTHHDKFSKWLARTMTTVAAECASSIDTIPMTQDSKKKCSDKADMCETSSGLKKYSSASFDDNAIDDLRDTTTMRCDYINKPVELVCKSSAERNPDGVVATKNYTAIADAIVSCAYWGRFASRSDAKHAYISSCLLCGVVANPDTTFLDAIFDRDDCLSADNFGCENGTDKSVQDSGSINVTDDTKSRQSPTDIKRLAWPETAVSKGMAAAISETRALSVALAKTFSDDNARLVSLSFITHVLLSSMTTKIHGGHSSAITYIVDPCDIFAIVSRSILKELAVTDKDSVKDHSFAHNSYVRTRKEAWYNLIPLFVACSAYGKGNDDASSSIISSDGTDAASSDTQETHMHDDGSQTAMLFLISAINTAYIGSEATRIKSIESDTKLNGIVTDRPIVAAAAAAAADTDATFGRDISTITRVDADSSSSRSGGGDIMADGSGIPIMSCGDAKSDSPCDFSNTRYTSNELVVRENVFGTLYHRIFCTRDAMLNGFDVKKALSVVHNSMVPLRSNELSDIKVLTASMAATNVIFSFARERVTCTIGTIPIAIAMTAAKRAPTWLEILCYAIEICNKHQHHRHTHCVDDIFDIDETHQSTLPSPLVPEASLQSKVVDGDTKYKSVEACAQKKSMKLDSDSTTFDIDADSTRGGKSLSIPPTLQTTIPESDIGSTKSGKKSESKSSSSGGGGGIFGALKTMLRGDSEDEDDEEEDDGYEDSEPGSDKEVYDDSIVDVVKKEEDTSPVVQKHDSVVVRDDQECVHTPPIDGCHNTTSQMKSGGSEIKKDSERHLRNRDHDWCERVVMSIPLECRKLTKTALCLSRDCNAAWFTKESISELERAVIISSDTGKSQEPMVDQSCNPSAYTHAQQSPRHMTDDSDDSSLGGAVVAIVSANRSGSGEMSSVCYDDGTPGSIGRTYDSDDDDMLESMHSKAEACYITKVKMAKETIEENILAAIAIACTTTSGDITAADRILNVTLSLCEPLCESPIDRDSGTGMDIIGKSQKQCGTGDCYKGVDYKDGIYTSSGGSGMYGGDSCYGKSGHTLQYQTKKSKLYRMAAIVTGCAFATSIDNHSLVSVDASTTEKPLDPQACIAPVPPESTQKCRKKTCCTCKRCSLPSVYKRAMTRIWHSDPFAVFDAAICLKSASKIASTNDISKESFASVAPLMFCGVLTSQDKVLSSSSASSSSSSSIRSAANTPICTSIAELARSLHSHDDIVSVISAAVSWATNSSTGLEQFLGQIEAMGYVIKMRTRDDKTAKVFDMGTEFTDFSMVVTLGAVKTFSCACTKSAALCGKNCEDFSAADNTVALLRGRSFAVAISEYALAVHDLPHSFTESNGISAKTVVESVSCACAMVFGALRSSGEIKRWFSSGFSEELSKIIALWNTSGIERWCRDMATSCIATFSKDRT